MNRDLAEANQVISNEFNDAHMKMALILPLINWDSGPRDLYKSKIAYCREAAEGRSITWTDGTTVTVSPRTVLNWYYSYQKDGMDGLRRQPRSDMGKTRALGEQAQGVVQDLRAKYPRLGATGIFVKLTEQNIPGRGSISSVRRFMLNTEAPCPVPPEEKLKDRKAFEAPCFGQLWQTDSYQGHTLTEDGEEHKTYCIEIIDDHTRLITAGHFFYNDNTANFLAVLYEAVLTYGIPVLLYTDRGGPYISEFTTAVCDNLGINLVHAGVKQPQGKGKIERAWGSLQTSFIHATDPADIKSLEMLDSMYHIYVDKYHNTVHSMTEETPQHRYDTSPSVIRPVPGSTLKEKTEWVRERFKVHKAFRVAGDNTVKIQGVQLDVPFDLDLAGKVARFRFIPFDIADSAELIQYYYDSASSERKTRTIRLGKTDKEQNSRSKRRKTPKLDYSKQ